MTPSPAAGMSIVLIGLMGAGKTTVGRQLAQRLDLPFIDADDEITKAAGCSIVDIFKHYGEEVFRDAERRVIARLLTSSQGVLATGGGAFVDPETRARIKSTARSVWLRADLETLVDRTIGRKSRPLLNSGDPRTILSHLMAERYPVYAEADIVVDTGDQAASIVVDRIVEALSRSEESST